MATGLLAILKFFAIPCLQTNYHCALAPRSTAMMFRLSCSTICIYAASFVYVADMPLCNILQGGYGSNCAGGVCKPGAGAYSRFADSSEGMASGKFSSTFSSKPGPLHTFQNSGNFPRRPLQQSINRAGIIQPTNKGYMG